MLPQTNVIDCGDARYLLFNTNDHISTQLYRAGSWEGHLIKISSFIVDGIDAPLIVDIGANLGAYSIPLAKSLNSLGGVIYGFEPQKIVYYQLCGNIILNRLDNYEAFNMAVGDQNGMIKIPSQDYGSHNNIGAFSMVKEYRQWNGVDEFSDTNNLIDAQVITLDSFKFPKAPSLVKIDVEGYELNVLKGACQFLEECSFPPLLFEAWNFALFDAERNKLLDFVSRLGYDITLKYNIDYVAQHPSHSIRVDFPSQDGIINMVRVR